MKLFDVGGCQLPLTGDEIEETVYRSLMIMDHGGDSFRALPATVGYERCIDTALDEDLRHTAIKSVDPLYKPSFDSPLPFEAFIESLKPLYLLELESLFLPDCCQLSQLRLGERLGGHLVVLDWSPCVDDLLAHSETIVTNQRLNCRLSTGLHPAAADSPTAAGAQPSRRATASRSS